MHHVIQLRQCLLISLFAIFSAVLDASFVDSMEVNDLFLVNAADVVFCPMPEIQTGV